jgi:hypothetical protein
MPLLLALLQQRAAHCGGVLVGSSCAKSDANLLLLRQVLCQSLGGPFPGFPECRLPPNLTAEGDWPNQAVYMRDLMVALVAPSTW